MGNSRKVHPSAIIKSGAWVFCILLGEVVSFSFFFLNPSISFWILIQNTMPFSSELSKRQIKNSNCFKDPSVGKRDWHAFFELRWLSATRRWMGHFLLTKGCDSTLDYEEHKRFRGWSHAVGRYDGRSALSTNELIYIWISFLVYMVLWWLISA